MAAPSEKSHLCYMTASRSEGAAVANGLPANPWARDIQGVIGLQEIGQYLQLWHLIERTGLTERPDADLEVDDQWRVLCPLGIPGILPWRDHLRELEAQLENLGATKGQILPMACKSG
jgi:hypothetical protein